MSAPVGRNMHRAHRHQRGARQLSGVALRATPAWRGCHILRSCIAARQAWSSHLRGPPSPPRSHPQTGTSHSAPCPNTRRTRAQSRRRPRTHHRVRLMATGRLTRTSQNSRRHRRMPISRRPRRLVRCTLNECTRRRTLHHRLWHRGWNPPWSRHNGPRIPSCRPSRSLQTAWRHSGSPRSPLNRSRQCRLVPSSSTNRNPKSTHPSGWNTTCPRTGWNSNSKGNSSSTSSSTLPHTTTTRWSTSPRLHHNNLARTPGTGSRLSSPSRPWPRASVLPTRPSRPLTTSGCRTAGGRTRGRTLPTSHGASLDMSVRWARRSLPSSRP